MAVSQQVPPRDTDPDFDWSWAEDDDGNNWVPPAIDTTRPSAARMYDYALGGKDNFAVDREAAERAFQVIPDGRLLARTNRDFLARAVRLMSESGIRQFVDLGTGIPTSPSVHEIAREADPAAHVVYVDNDPIVLAHNRAILDRADGVVTIMRDLREPARVLGDSELINTVDLDKPVGLLMIAVLHFVDLTVAPEVVQHYLSRLAPGSQVAFSVGTREGVPTEVTSQVERIYSSTQSPIVFRTRAQVEQLIDGLDLVDPGLSEITQWRAEGTPLTMRMLAGVGIKR
jgi:hypothetical protein